MKISLLPAFLVVVGSLISCQSSIAAEGSGNEMNVCSRSPDIQLEMNPSEIFVSWATASPYYDPTFRLIPEIVLTGTVSGIGFDAKPGEIFLQFWPNAEATKATWAGIDENKFYFDYPFSHLESILKIVEGPNAFRVLYRVQDGRCYGLIEVAKRPIPFKLNQQ